MPCPHLDKESNCQNKHGPCNNWVEWNAEFENLEKPNEAYCLSVEDK